MAARAYSKNTVRAQKADGAIFQAFCEERGLAFFPASPGTIRGFVEYCVEIGKKSATISRAHIAAGLSSPAATEAVRVALKWRRRRLPGRIKHWLRGEGDQGIYRFWLRADREKALLCVAYDTMARRSELVGQKKFAVATLRLISTKSHWYFSLEPLAESRTGAIESSVAPPATAP
jgi:hypothetical protein